MKQMRVQILNRLHEAKVVAIVRGLKKEKVRPVADALLRGGIKAIEVTFDTPGAKDMIEVLRDEYAGKMLIGAGTVLDTETARTAILSGADFVLAPTVNTQMIELCNRYSRIAVPGAMTPTEILTAWEAGAGMVKLFPAGVLTPKYVKDVLGPLKHISLMAVGGITLGNAAEFLKAGADALGIASDLVSMQYVNEDNFAAIEDAARQFVQIAASN